MKLSHKLVYTSSIAILFAFVLNSCTNEKGPLQPDYKGYPENIGKIIVTKCATPGCHTDANKELASGVSLESWNSMFEGYNEGAVAIPYRHDFSAMFFHINTYSDLGVMVDAAERMPKTGAALTREEVKEIMNWIDAGAPNSEGFVKYSDNANRKKFYVTNQACDVVTVFDEETLLPMRYINVGNSPSTEAPHNIKISPDGKYWYIISTAGNSLQKYNTSDDSFVGEAILGIKNWNTVTISKDGNTAYAVDWSSVGDIAVVDLNALTTTHNIGFTSPHGSCLNQNGDTLYVTENTSSNKMYKIPVNDFSAMTEINLFTTTPSTFLNSHEIVFSPDGSKYFVTCQGTSEVRIFQTNNDALLATIAMGALPSEMSISATHNYLFVTCQEDTLSNTGLRGSVAVIDINSNSLVSTIYAGHQPHGIAVDDNNNLVYVANRNVSSDAPAPHHPSSCGGNNGYVTFIDMNTLSLLKTDDGEDKMIEISVDPYSIAVRP